MKTPKVRVLIRKITLNDTIAWGGYRTRTSANTRRRNPVVVRGNSRRRITSIDTRKFSIVTKRPIKPPVKPPAEVASGPRKNPRKPATARPGRRRKVNKGAPRVAVMRTPGAKRGKKRKKKERQQAAPAAADEVDVDVDVEVDVEADVSGLPEVVPAADSFTTFVPSDQTLEEGSVLLFLLFLLFCDQQKYR